MKPSIPTNETLAMLPDRQAVYMLGSTVTALGIAHAFADFSDKLPPIVVKTLWNAAEAERQDLEAAIGQELADRLLNVFDAKETDQEKTQ